ncbi:hypothetical protein WI40_07805 [Burkholderia ubonensis]|uniref:tyrosine-type recombinase/integrase n=1 Tax=Burkholderia ubonensis TaxID=101571 RepID=UPI000759D3E7|nr:tyrosine-type recombinase/integrase [Burkholderia ubonensis]KVA01425.1 hypothetical protein WI40_07805 [Burkholderia ubonensis]
MREKFEHEDDAGNGVTVKVAPGYSVRGARGLVRWAVEQLLEKIPDLTEPEGQRLAGLSPHPFRHMFGTRSVATDAPLEVVQQLLGHASLQTTSVYVTAEGKAAPGRDDSARSCRILHGRCYRTMPCRNS